jgi:hypothetical protein
MGGGEVLLLIPVVLLAAFLAVLSLLMPYFVWHIFKRMKTVEAAMLRMETAVRSVDLYARRIERIASEATGIRVEGPTEPGGQ